MRKILNAFLVLSLAAVACNFPTNLPSAAEPTSAAGVLASATAPQGAAVAPPTLPPTPDPAASPTPDNPHNQPELRGESIQYVVQPFDTLGAIAEEFNVTVEELVAANNLANPNQLEVGQVLTIPALTTTGLAPSYKIIPDSELVNGPAAIYFDPAAFIQGQGGYLASYQEQVGDEFHSGARILMQVAADYSVNPRILLAVLEQQSGWVTNPTPASATLAYPMAFFDTFREGLLRQLSWAADNLNRGFYDWRSGQAAGWTTVDGAFVPAAPTINAGTAGVQALFAKLYNEALWRSLVGEGGFSATYQRLFGNPFSYAIEPLVPSISQPIMQLPFEVGVPWVYSGGPHSGWGSGSAWAALDFAPRGDMLGCNQSADWVVAAADGLIVRSDDGAVVQDMDGDGYEQSGWTILYMHMAASGRAAVGTQVRAGDRIGHPSCEGGVASASHLHLARRYNGVWIPAFGDYAFVLDGWLSVSSGTLYNGYLQRDGQSVEACECRDPQHMLQR